MKTRALPEASHVSAAVRALNPKVFGPLPSEKLAAEVLGKEGGTRLKIGGPSLRIAQDDSVLGAGAPRGGRKMNLTEARYAAILEAQKGLGRIRSYRFEGVRLKWGTDAKTGQAMFYKPDFLVDTGAGWKCIEVKGAYIYEHAPIRFKGCRAEWPEFEFEMWQWKERAWSRVL